MSESVDELLVHYDTQLRGLLPEQAAFGAVVEQDGPFVRTHYGTHGTVEHRALSSSDLDGSIIRQRDAFAARDEPVEWKIHADDAAIGLADRLRLAGFTRGWERAVLAAPIGQLRPVSPMPSGAVLVDRLDRRGLEKVGRLVAGTGPHRTPFTEFRENGGAWMPGMDVLAVKTDGEFCAAIWAECVTGTDFVAVGGLVDTRLAFVDHLCAWDWQRSGLPAWVRRPHARHLIVEADGPLRTALLDAGMQAITTVTSYHWAPPTHPAKTRPTAVLFDDPEHDMIWDRFETRFDFRPGMARAPAITEPADSVTWHLGALDALGPEGVDRLQSIIQNGLLACTPADEVLYWLDWQHQGYRFDPRRVGGPGQPRWPGFCYPDGDYYLYLNSEATVGTFGHPWEYSLCVFGSELLAKVEEPITQLLTKVLRRGGHNVNNVWSFGPDDPQP